MKFWTPYIILAVIFIISGIWLLEQMAQDDGAPKFARDNQAARGFTEFYEKLRRSVPKGEAEDGVIQLDLGSETLEEKLQALPSVAPEKARAPSSAKLDGRFRKGDTLKKKLSELASQQGVSVVWQLEKDFEVKASFQVKESLVDTAEKMTKAIASEFSTPIYVYFCPSQQTIVVTLKNTAFLYDNCQRSTEYR